MIQLGLDYASVDGNSAPDFALMVAAGVKFAIIRKSFVIRDVKTGAIHLTPDYHYFRDAGYARMAGLTVGAYGFFSFATDAPSAADQVKALVQAPGDVIPGEDLPYCVDVEFPGRGIADTGRTQHEAFSFLLEIIAEVRKQTGTSPLIYTSHGQWHDSNGLGGPDSPDLDGCPLWLKTPYRLNARQHVDTVAPRRPHLGPAADDPHDYWRLPLPWERQGWWLQQCQGDALGFPGMNQTADVSQFEILDPSTNDPARITMIQRRLCVLGAPFLGPLNASGAWDTDTTQALHAYQVAHHLPVTGVIDVATFASLCW